MTRLFGLAVFLVLTCADAIQPYNVAVKNVTSAELQDAFVSYGEFKSLGGSLRPGNHTRHGPVPFPVPDRATVTWRTADGVEHTKEVAVKPAVPADFSGDIFFDIEDGNQVRLRAEPRQPLR